MTFVDWLLILVINGGIVLYGILVYKAQGQSFDWYLAARSMPWWVIGLSAFGTAFFFPSGHWTGAIFLSIDVFFHRRGRPASGYSHFLEV